MEKGIGFAKVVTPNTPILHYSVSILMGAEPILLGIAMNKSMRRRQL